MCQILCSVILLLFIHTRAVFGNPGGVGQDCLQDGSCTNRDLHVCDPSANNCLIKAGGVCVDGETKCVKGASTCTSTLLKCTCIESTHVQNGDLCKFKTGVAGCIVNSNCTKGAECIAQTGTTKMCHCNSDHVSSTARNGECVLKAGQICTNDAECTKNSACSTETPKKCTCSATYVQQPSGHCLLKAGQTCTTDAECTTNSTCSTDTPKTCTCSANYVQQPSGLCLKNAANSIILSVLLLFAASVFSLTTTYLNNAL